MATGDEQSQSHARKQVQSRTKLSTKHDELLCYEIAAHLQ
jgi:hypothetical protein